MVFYCYELYPQRYPFVPLRLPLYFPLVMYAISMFKLLQTILSQTPKSIKNIGIQSHDRENQLVCKHVKRFNGRCVVCRKAALEVCKICVLNYIQNQKRLSHFIVVYPSCNSYVTVYVRTFKKC